MDEHRRITPVGRRIAALPCDPKLGRMLLAAARLHCLTETAHHHGVSGGAGSPGASAEQTQAQADEAHAAMPTGALIL